MLKQNKGRLILSCALVLLPMLFGLLFWTRLPDVMTTHWGIQHTPDGFSKKPFAVIGLPLVLLGVHVLCLLVTSWDKRQQAQNTKVLGFVFWIVPVLSLFANGVVYCTALGKEFSTAWFAPALLGLLSVYIGNYLPKAKPNRTIGIRVTWTLRSEENWNKTHRFGGKLWVACGIALLGCAFLPQQWLAVGTVLVAAVGTVAPIVYSYCLHRKQAATE